MSSIRVWHTYLGMLIAPCVLFFALTGALQIFSLHETHGAYQPLPLVEKLGMLHKDQVFARKEPHKRPPEPTAAHAGPPPPPAEDDDRVSLGTLVLKWFFLLVAAGLTSSTVLGLWIGLTHLRHKRVALGLLAVGIVLPVALVIF
jgi:uncharacterized iron-regulated membrane protein